MARAFPKDAWLKDAIARRYLLVREDGTLFRAKSATPEGVVDFSKGYEKIVQQVHKPTGRVYFMMTWRGVRKSVLVNRAVAWRFHPNPQNLPQVNHLDGNKENNARDNLEWETASGNEKHAHATGLKSGRGSQNSNAKLTAADVLAIRASHEDAKTLAARYGVSRSTIVGVLSKRTWTHV